MPSLKTEKDWGHKILFHPVKQHASNTGLTVDCVESCKHQPMYTAKSLWKVKRNHLIV